MKLSPIQRETLALLKATDAATAADLRVPFKTLEILRHNGCVSAEQFDGMASLSRGVRFRITDKGRQEAAA